MLLLLSPLPMPAQIYGGDNEGNETRSRAIRLATTRQFTSHFPCARPLHAANYQLVYYHHHPQRTLPLHLSLSANGAGVGAQKLLMGLTYGHRSGFPFRNISLLRRYLFLTAFGDATSASKWEQIFSSFVWWWRGGGSNRWPIQPMSLSKTGRSSNLQSLGLILTDANTPSPKKSPSPGSL